MILKDVEPLEAIGFTIPKKYDPESFMAGAGLIENMLDELPVVERLEIIRCKDCKHSVPYEGKTQQLIVCKQHSMFGNKFFAEPWFYCADAERQDEDGSKAD